MIKLLKSHPFFSDKTIDSCTLLEHQGYCNENYLVVAEGKKYIARKLLRDDIDRVFEYKVQRLAFEQGITAEPFVFDEANAFMVSQFLEGVHKSKLDENNLKHLAYTLQTLHSIEVYSKPITLHIKDQTDEVLKAFETIAKYDLEYALCHNDLNPQNVFFSDAVTFIDWEYASVSDRYFDLACVSVEFKLDNEDEVFFLESYFLKEDVINYEKHKAYKVIYKFLCEEWFKENP